MTNLIADTTGQFHSHVNMLIGVFFLDRFPKSMYDNLEVMYENIKTELYLSIQVHRVRDLKVNQLVQETANLSPEAKRNLLHTLNVTEKHFGLPEIFRNMDLLQDYFQVVNQTITEGIAKRGYQQMKPEQRIRAIAQMLQLAAKRFRAQHPTIVDDYSWTKIHTKHPEHHSVFQFDSSVWFHSVSVVISGTFKLNSLF
ncbi:hypothetical protein L596_007610 [Steinernema carpocapsae]|uniref:Uncharacterized protein n=1 Tax=Steinernema carpocapsae TaxID=34508 RepID=A0A4U5PAU9_STECR|nr:hypothetical protein L596_007610 [Steinernema carpocapsae]